MVTPAGRDVRTTLRQDALVALAVAVLLFVGSAVTWRHDLRADLPRTWAGLLPPPMVAALLLAESVPLTFRRLQPLPVLAACVAASLGLQAIGEPSLLPLGVLVAIGTVAVRLRPLLSVAAGAGYLLLLGAGMVSGLTPLEDDGFYVYLVSLTATVMLGYGIALGRFRAGLAERKAAELAREQEERTRAAVVQEQARIAREVHDIVAHDVSVMVAQAAAAHRLLPEGDAAAPTLQAIETVGRDALDGLRRLVTLLRTDGGGALRSPQPTLAGLPALLTQVRAAGLPVDLVVHGEARELPGTVETNAYRIVQEGLTNALKHAGPARAAVVLDYRADALRVEVRDDGRGAATASVPFPRGGTPVPAGFGLVSMQQRAALLDGQVEAGPGEHGGFQVTVLLPLKAG